MKRWLIAPLLLLIINSQSMAQEMLVDSINRSKFTGLHQGGEMGSFLYVPYFTTNKADKKNFIIRQLNGHTYREEQVLRLELPATFSLKASTFNGSSYLLHFYDEAKKEDVLISTVGENISKKKAVKASGETYFLFSGTTPEDFVIVTVSNKGNYKIEKTGIALESKWEKKFSAPSGTDRQIVSIKNKMGTLEIIRKDSKSNGKYEFSIHYVQLDNGEDMAQSSLSGDDTKLYPTFFSEKEGMSFTGGYYFTDGIYSTDPVGVFFALVTPDGNIERITTVPYSQVIEDLKNTVGGKLSDDNTAIIFTDGFMAHEIQSFVIVGQVVSRQNKDNTATITFGDFVSLKFSMEQKYKGAVSTSYEGSQVVINNISPSINTLDLGIWMNNASLLPYSHLVTAPGMPIMAYRKYEKGGETNLCFKPLGIKNDTTQPECMMLYRYPETHAPYEFTGNLPVKPFLFKAIIPSGHDMNNIATYQLTNNTLLLTKTPIPKLENIMVPIMPEHIEDREEPNDGAPTEPEPKE